MSGNNKRQIMSMAYFAPFQIQCTKKDLHMNFMTTLQLQATGHPLFWDTPFGMLCHVLQHRTSVGETKLSCFNEMYRVVRNLRTNQITQ